MSRAVWTVGHSTRTLPAFLDLLAESKIGSVADVRRFPASRRHPHFNGEALRASLAEKAIDYHHFLGLGGRRSTHTAGSPNTAWRVEAFNAFADHLATEEGATALDELIARANAVRVAIICSEAVPWRCHRRIIADALVAQGWTVWDIVGAGKVDRHALPEFARVDEAGKVTYPGLFGGGEADASSTEPKGGSDVGRADIH